jgi:RNA polymerase sigma-70 factor, ECF subfamily
MTDLAQVTMDKSITVGSPIRGVDTKTVNASDWEATSAPRTVRNDISPGSSARKSQAQTIPGEVEASFSAATLATIPRLRAFALSLSRNVDRADDLVQETLLRAFSNWRRFEPDSNLQAWLIIILRNAFYSEQRSRRREVEDGNGAYAKTLVTQAEQGGRLECDKLSKALGRLPYEMREAVLLIGAYGFSYREAASLCDCAIGTIKSRVNRARAYLAAALALESQGHFVQDAIFQGIAVRAEQSRSRHP